MRRGDGMLRWTIIRSALAFSLAWTPGGELCLRAMREEGEQGSMFAFCASVHPAHHFTACRGRFNY